MNKSTDKKENIDDVKDARSAKEGDGKHNNPHAENQNKRSLLRFELDNSAKFYPVVSTKKAQSLYCMGAVLKDEIDPTLLEEAANQIIDKFPTLKVRLRKGYSWHYLEENTARIKVFEIDNIMLRPIDPEQTNGYWFRISCGGDKVKVDMFHGLTDGNGAMSFLKALLLRYRELQGVVIDDKMNIADLLHTPQPQELEDSFYANYKPIHFKDLDLKAMAGSVPLRLKGTPVDEGYLISMGTAKIADILKNAKSMGASFTSYIAGLIAYTIASIAPSGEPIVVMIPVNLRNLFPSKTLRNFVTFVRLIFKANECKSLEEFVSQADKQLKEKASKNKMEEFISTTVRAQANILLRITPLFLKTFFIKLGRLFMRSRQTIIFSNLGKMDVPKELELDRFLFHMNVSKYNAQNIGAVSVGENVTFAFTRAIKETTLTDAFFNNLRKQGVRVETIEESAFEETKYFYTKDTLSDKNSEIK